MTDQSAHDDWLRIARVFAKPDEDVVLIDPDNAGVGLCRLEDLDAALDSNPRAAAVAVRPIDGVLVVDVDRRQVRDQLRRALKYLPGVRLIRCTSGGRKDDDGGFESEHWILVTPEGSTTNEFAESLVSLGLPNRDLRRGDGGRTRPPLSPHRLGGAGRLLEPCSVDEVVAILKSATAPLGKRAVELADHESPRPRAATLAPEVLELARKGRAVDPGRYKDRHTAAFGFARRLAEAGWTFEDFVGFLADGQMAIGERFREERSRSGEDAALARALQTWKRAVSQVGAVSAAHPDRFEHNRQVIEWRDSCLSWVGADPRHRDADRAFLRAVADLLIRHHSWKVLPGVRGLGDEMGMTAKSAASAIQRWEAYGAIGVHRQPHHRSTLESDRLIVRLDWAGLGAVGGGEERPEGWFPDLGNAELYLPLFHPCWNRSGLGATAVTVYWTLKDGPYTASELVEHSLVSAHGVREALSRLVDTGERLGVPLIASSTAAHAVWWALPLEDSVEIADRISDELTFTSGGRPDRRSQMTIDRRLRGRRESNAVERSRSEYQRSLAASHRHRRLPSAS